MRGKAEGFDRRKARLTWQEVYEIRRLEGEQSPGDLAKRFQISRQTVWNIITNRVWKEDF